MGPALPGPTGCRTGAGYVVGGPAGRVPRRAGAVLGQHLQGLSRAGIVDTVTGAHGGYRLARPAGEITVLDAVLSIEGDESAFRCTEIRRQGPAGLPDSAYRSVCGVHRVMGAAELAWRQTLTATTIADLGVMVMADTKPEALVKAAEWLQQAVG